MPLRRFTAPKSTCCQHCGSGREVETVEVVPTRGGAPRPIRLCGRCRTTPARWVSFRPVAAASRERR